MKPNIETVYELYVDEIFEETLIQIYGFSTFKSNDIHDQAFQRTTLSQNAGLLRLHSTRTITAKNALAGRGLKCYNFLMESDHLPQSHENVDKIMFKKFITSFNELYILDSEITFNLIFG